MSYKVCVDGFPSSLDDEELANLFSTFGTVLSVHRSKDPTGQPMGFAEVEMAQPEEADKAIQALHRIRVSGELVLVFPDSVLPDR